MRISHKYKFVYIAPPKTGSETIREMLDQYSDVIGGPPGKSLPYTHIKAYGLKKYFKENNWNWDEYFKFSFARNPWNRVVSRYEYRKLRAKENTSFGRSSAKMVRGKNFRKFLKKGTRGFGACCDYFFDSHGNQLMDFIGKLENLQTDFNTICDNIGIPRQQLPHRNKTKHKHYSEYYDDETRQIVAEKYAKDIEYFGYEFGE
jgi:hypothetical protein